MNYLLTMLICIAALSAHAFVELPGAELSEIEGATLVCADQGAAFAIKVGGSGSEYKVWQTDLLSNGELESTGILLEGLQVKLYRCPYCFDFAGSNGLYDIKASVRSTGGQDINLAYDVAGDSGVLSCHKLSQ